MNHVNNPPHYQGASPIGRDLLGRYMRVSEEDLNLECIDFIERNYQYCSFHLGNAIKYLWRCGIKGDAVEDLNKALWYLRRWQSEELKSFNFFYLSWLFTSKSRHQLNKRIDRLASAIEVALSKT